MVRQRQGVRRLEWWRTVPRRLPSGVGFVAPAAERAVASSALTIAHSATIAITTATAVAVAHAPARGRSSV
jgi:hypothetical protein